MANPNITSADLEAMGLKVFDPAEYITSDEAAVAYINEALAENDAALLASALGDVARARGMTEIAKGAGIARESLYKALRQNSQPRMETIGRVLTALGLRLVVEPIVEPATALAKKKKTSKTKAVPAKARAA
ncbi:addiction module antidote protein [Duganella vulcania]|nr:addiction module antidote protein [Duganella vulcania]